VLRQPAALSYCLHRREFANDPCQGPIIANAVEPGFPVPGSRAFLERAKQNVRKDRCIPCADRRAPEKRSIFKNDSWYELYCFAQRQDADSFQELFGGHLIQLKADD